MSEPIAVETARARLGLASNFRDPEIAGLVASAIEHVEDLTGFTIAERNVVEEVTLEIGLPVYVQTRPIKQLVAVEYVDQAGASVEIVDPILVASGDKQMLLPPEGEAWPAGVLSASATFVAGYAGTAEDQVPEKLLQAVLLLVSAWFDDPAGAKPEPPQLRSMLAGFRRYHV